MPLVFDHDGSVDDFAALVLLLQSGRRIDAVLVTDGDCRVDAAVTVTRRILALHGTPDVPVFRNRSTPTNPFPSAWRDDSLRIAEFPALRLLPADSRTALSGEQALLRLAQSSVTPIEVISTSPLSSIAAVLRSDPGIADRIASVVWMGGAFEAAGNVAEAGHNGSAEWNSYADPQAAYSVLSSGIPVSLCPLDVCHKVPVDGEFVDWLAERRHLVMCDLLASLYSLVVYREYYAWDLTTVAYRLWPEIFETVERDVYISVNAPGQGRTMIAERGFRSTIVTDVDAPELIARFKRVLSRE